MINLNRADKQYTDIENFKKYELTYCIAYEMAIRNDEVIKAIKGFVKDYAKYDLEECEIITSTNDFKKCRKYTTILMDYWLNPLSLYLDYHFFKDIKDEDIKKDIEDNWLFKIFLSNLKKLKWSKSHKQLTFRDFNYQWIIFYGLIERKRKISFYDKFVFKGVKKHSYFTDIGEKKYKETISPLCTHSLLYDDKEKNILIGKDSITPNYSRPFDPDVRHIKQKQVILNLSLPTNELTDFIERLKKDNSSIQNFYNLFDLELKDGNFKNEKLPRINYSYADMLFIYDCRKLGYTQSRIISKIDRYYEDLDPTSPTVQPRLISKYENIAKEYIDDKKYKHLVT